MNEIQDDLPDILSTTIENGYLASSGGGIGTYWGNVRSMFENVADRGKSSGIIPFIKMQDSQTLAISQGSLRRGSAAVYLPVWHPEIEEFVDIRRPTLTGGGDQNRRCHNIHHGVVINDAFMEAAKHNKEFALKEIKSGKIVKMINARELWQKILITRMETGEPYILFIDNVNKTTPIHHKEMGLDVKTSNLCSEIMLPTSKERTAVCCLSSVNLEYFDEWKNDDLFIKDIMYFLDNVLEDFVKKGSNREGFEKAVLSASHARSVGLGVMGYHFYLQKNSIPFEESHDMNKKIFSHIKEKSNAANYEIAKELGSCHDVREYNRVHNHDLRQRFSHCLAIAPTASISIICGETSPCIEPLNSNVYPQVTLSGSFIVKNKYLRKKLKELNLDTDLVWSSIIRNHGSVQQLSHLDEKTKKIFKTSWEIDPMSIIQLAAERGEYIDQGQSLNLFIHANVNKMDLHKYHYEAWKLGLKSLYYLRTKSTQQVEWADTTMLDECLVCQ